MSFHIGTAPFNANSSIESSLLEGLNGNYNTPVRVILEDGGITELELPAGDYHSIAFACLSGSCNLEIGAEAPTLIVAGEAAEWSASTLINRAMNFVLVGGKIVITALKRNVVAV